MGPDAKDEKGLRIIARNKRALRDYNIEQKFEAGLVLMGTEVKSLRLGHGDLSDGYAALRGDELFLVGINISPYSHGGHHNHEPKRERKLLMHRQEINRLIGRIRERGYTLIPLSLYFRNGKAKVSLGLAKGKKSPDKRREIKERDMEREMRQESHNRKR